MSSAKTFTAAVGTAGLAAAIFLVLLPCPSNADDESATIGDLAVEAVGATPAKAGETTRITFSIENSGADRVTVTGVRWPTGEPSRVVGFLGTSHSTTLGGLPIDAGELVQLDNKTAWVEVGPLKADLAPGAVVLARLVLGRFEAPLSVHVSPQGKSVAAVSGGDTKLDGPTQSISRSIISDGPNWLKDIKC